MRRTIGDSQKKKRTYESPMDAALRFLTHTARSEREVERFLDGADYDEVAVMETVERLRELKLVGDAAYAADFVETRLAAKPVSRAHLRQQLLQHEVSEAAIDGALLAVTDEAEDAHAFAVAEKYDRQLSALPDEERYARVIKRILSRGFSFDTARAAMERLVREAPEV